MGRLASSDTLPGEVISVPSGQTPIEAAASGIVHVEIGGEIGSGWTGRDAALIIEVLILWEAVLYTLHAGLEGVVIGGADVDTLLQEWISIPVLAVSHADTGFSEVPEWACVHADMICWIFFSIIWTYAVTNSFKSIFQINATVSHTDFVDYFSIEVGRALGDTTQRGLVAEEIRPRTELQAFPCGLVSVERHGQNGTK